MDWSPSKIAEQTPSREGGRSPNTLDITFHVYTLYIHFYVSSFVWIYTQFVGYTSHVLWKFRFLSGQYYLANSFQNILYTLVAATRHKIKRLTNHFRRSLLFDAISNFHFFFDSRKCHFLVLEVLCGEWDLKNKYIRNTSKQINKKGFYSFMKFSLPIYSFVIRQTGLWIAYKIITINKENKIITSSHTSFLVILF